MTQLALGTVQFGTDYGITNRSGRVAEQEVREIVLAAVNAGVSVLDTAAAYGDAEYVVGRCLPPGSRLRIVTKTVPLRTEHIDSGSLNKVSQGIERSMELLMRPQLDGVMVHHAKDLLVPGGDKLFALLQAEQAQGRIGKIGVSVYGTAELAALVPRYPIELVQLPLNVLDQRLLTAGWIHRLHEAGVEIHVRSAFLQGTLLADAGSLPDRIGVIKAGVRNFQNVCSGAGLDRTEMCLGFLQSLQGISYVVCGVAGLQQFSEIAAAWERCKALAAADYAPFALPDHPYLSPANWPR
jgi:aryl-alcohol dehydrogenase-like predicted oxidoreductase